MRERDFEGSSPGFFFFYQWDQTSSFKIIRQSEILTDRPGKASIVGRRTEKRSKNTRKSILEKKKGKQKKREKKPAPQTLKVNVVDHRR